MKKFDELCNMVQNEMRGINKNVIVTSSINPKNNNKYLKGLNFRKEDEFIGPIIYVDGLLQQLEDNEISIEDAASSAIESYLNSDINFTNETVLPDKIDREYILENVIYALVNKERNKTRLLDMPFIELEDLAAIFKVIVSITKDGRGTFTLSKEMLRIYNITEYEIYTAAHKNTRRLTGVVIKNMSSIINELLSESNELEIDLDTMELPDMDLWVITNEIGIDGAAALMYRSELKELADKLDDDLYLLPSSIHEAIAIKKSFGNPEQLREMVKDINNNEVRPEEQLSDSVYTFNRITCELTLV